MKHAALSLALLVLVPLLCQCGVGGFPQAFIREDVDYAYIKEVAVPALENNSKDEHVAERVRDHAITQLLVLRLFDVVDKGIVDNAMKEEGLEEGAALDPPALKRLGQRLKVQALLLGTVDQAEEVQLGAVGYPVLGLTFRLLDTSTGQVIWQASGRRDGDKIINRIFGLSPDDDYHVSMNLVRSMFDTIPDFRE